MVPDDGFVTVIPDDGFVTMVPDDGFVTMIPDDGFVTMIPDDGFVTMIPDHRGLRDRWRIDNRRIGDRWFFGNRRFFDRRIDNGWLSHRRRISHRRGRTGIRRGRGRARVHGRCAGVRGGLANGRARVHEDWAGVRGAVTERVTPDGSSHSHATIGPDDSGNVAGDLRPRVRDVSAGLRGAARDDLHRRALLPAGKRNAAQLVVREDDGSRRGQGN
ncbi:hypothetical protein [Rhodococcus opacus]|uniref:Uncharacterized protein n=1 Tax=Rhodococcus opacus TaxID=37919 RepID=A0A076EXK8_RHOOP|nr:hypothetical protein [Rhodococcus opacus]AII10720.1 hypothetical protein EP51_41680 [Rhodococcus opacus]